MPCLWTSVSIGAGGGGELPTEAARDVAPGPDRIIHVHTEQLSSEWVDREVYEAIFGRDQ